MPANFRLTLGKLFAISLLGLALSLAALFYFIFDGTQRTILQSAERFRASASREAGGRVTDYLNEAPQAVAHFEKQLQYRLINVKESASIQAGLLSLLIANENLSEATFTYADGNAKDPTGNIRLDPSKTGQVAIFRAADGRFVIKRTWFEGGRFVAESVTLRGGSNEAASEAQRELSVPNPTDHLTFQTPVSKDFYGRLLWTDLHWSQLSESLPSDRRSIEVSVQKTIETPDARFAGVLRIGLMKEQIDRAIDLHLAGRNESDPHVIFLCDKQGRLITGFGKNSRVTESGNDLRMASNDVPPQVTEALRKTDLKNISAENPVSNSFRSASRVYLCTFRTLPETQEWIVGIVVPRDYYLGELLQIQRRILWVSLVLIVVIIKFGGFILHNVSRALSLIVRETSRMNAFEFSVSKNSSRLSDVDAVLEGMEKAKTAMRAMSKYVPVDLVRRLYHDGREPVLGGESIELSVLFTDIKDFTPFAERIAPEMLAQILGRYLHVMATVIQSEQGTIDKYIGDAVMAFWNAPEAVAGHAVFACRAALQCRAALRILFDSPEWKAAPRFETRFGLHRCIASVGHFGAPDRFNYTAIGDGINFCSRLEGLNKYYGTSIIASENIHAFANEKFEFRLLDRVAVKGKTQGVTIYELVSENAPASPRSSALERYEQAFHAYQRADFKSALGLLENETIDAPSRVLAGRCRQSIENPPPDNWDGVHIFESK
jgi:adenylate cyclase